MARPLTPIYFHPYLANSMFIYAVNTKAFQRGERGRANRAHMSLRRGIRMGKHTGMFHGEHKEHDIIFVKALPFMVHTFGRCRMVS